MSLGLLRYYWCYRGEPRAFPRPIEVVRAVGPQEACAAFGLPFPSGYVHELTSPRLQREAEKFAPGTVGTVHAAEMPTSRDWAIERGYH